MNPWKFHFPIFRAHPALVYLDSASTAQRPSPVLAAMERFSEEENANVHRGLYKIAEAATAAYEGARGEVARFVHADPGEIVFTRGTTEGSNLFAATWGRANLRAGDEIILSSLEHHAIVVPWTELARELGVTVKVIPLRPNGTLMIETLDVLITERTKLVAVTHCSNVLGTMVDVAEVARKAHAAGAIVLVDAAQSVAHLPIDVRALDCDVLLFSAHKMYGPFGVGALYAKRAILDAMPPYQRGGDMIRSVSWEGIEYNDAPWKFEAGTPNASGAVGFAEAVRFTDKLRAEGAPVHEQALTQECCARLAKLPYITLYGPAHPADRGPVLSFNVNGVHPHDVATILDSHDIAVRGGHHCAMPLMTALGLAATTRVSFGPYNDPEDIDRLEDALKHVHQKLGT